MAKGAFGAQVELKGAGSGAGTPSTGITGLSSRQVLFGSSDGGVAQMASFQIDSTLAYLGIGTSAPATDIHIQHGGTTAAGITVQQTTNREAFLQTIVSVAGAANGFGLFQESTRLHLRVSDTAGSTVGASLVTFERSGNVGIGTTAPSAPLDVLSTLGIVVSTGTTGTPTGYSFRGGAIGLAALSTGQMVLQIGGQGVIRMSTGGVSVRNGVAANLSSAALQVTSTIDGNTFLVQNTTAGNQPAFCIESSGTTSKIALWSTAGCTQRPGYATTGTTSRTMNSTITPAAVYSSDVGAQLNALQAVVKCLIQDLSAGTGLGLAASTV